MNMTTPGDDPLHDLPQRTNFYRRWLLVAILLAFVVPVGVLMWQMYRPLSAAERRLVGTWRNVTMGNVFTLHADRTSSAGRRRFGGQWYVTGDKLYLPDTRLQETLRTLLGSRVDDSRVITFEDDDHLTVFVPINGGTFHMERLDAPK